jgi:hypothetical protein
MSVILIRFFNLPVYSPILLYKGQLQEKIPVKARYKYKLCRKGDPEQREITHKRKDKKVSDVCCIKKATLYFEKKM